MGDVTEGVNAVFYISLCTIFCTVIVVPAVIPLPVILAPIGRQIGLGIVAVNGVVFPIFCAELIV